MSASRKSCSVPNCLVTSTNSPAKLFFSSPRNVRKRNAWLAAMKRDPKSLSPKTVFYVCEDHFNLEVDSKNFIALKYGQYTSGALKGDVLPHIFKCQDQKPNTPKNVRLFSERRSRKGLIETIDDSVENFPEFVLNDESTESISEINSKYVQCNLFENNSPKKRKPFRSRGIQCSMPSENVNVSVPPFPIPSGIGDLTETPMDVGDEDYSDLSHVSTISEYVPESSESVVSLNYSDEEIEKTKNMEIRHTVKKYFSSLCRRKSKKYLGIDVNAIHIIDILTKILKCSEIDLFIVLVKIRKDYTFEDIGDRFGISHIDVGKIFRQTLPQLCDCMKHFITWPSADLIKAALPIAFRKNYHNVQVIIDCFEIQIQKPTNPCLQALSWSNYKKANTIKYLVGSTPNGMVTYISKGFGGRCSDVEIIKKSGFLNILPKNCDVMADRGFKQIDFLLHQRSCKLVRPPSVSAGEKLTKSEVIVTKQIASLRIHIERVIKRLREFHLLEPYSCVTTHILKYLDQCVIIACGMINLQSELIKSE